MTVPDWSELTFDQQMTLLTTPAISITPGCELLDFDTLAATDDLTSALIPAGGWVREDGTSLVHRTANCLQAISQIRAVDFMAFNAVALSAINQIFTSKLARSRRRIGVLIVRDDEN